MRMSGRPIGITRTDFTDVLTVFTEFGNIYTLKNALNYRSKDAASRLSRDEPAGPDQKRQKTRNFDDD